MFYDLLRKCFWFSSWVKEWVIIDNCCGLHLTIWPLVTTCWEEVRLILWCTNLDIVYFLHCTSLSHTGWGCSFYQFFIFLDFLINRLWLFLKGQRQHVMEVILVTEDYDHHPSVIRPTWATAVPDYPNSSQLVSTIALVSWYLPGIVLL